MQEQWKLEDIAREEVEQLKRKIKQLPKRKNKTYLARVTKQFETLMERYNKVADDLELHTSWQWLAQYRRVVNVDVPCIELEYRFFDWDSHETEYKSWYYYRKKDTHKATEEEYERLKKMYIEMYGGWERIDLSSTTYNGKIWW